MNYSNNQALLSSLAAEYVLGTLEGPARRRFEQLKVKDQKVQAAVSYWETQLLAMASSIKPVQVPLAVWENIEQQLGFTHVSSAPVQQAIEVTTRVPERLAQKSSANQVWKAFTGLAVAASMMLAVFVYQYSADVASPLSVAVFANADQQTLWSLDVRKDQLFIRSTQNLQQRPNQDYQLWIVPASGDAPISLGLLNQRGTFSLPKPTIFDEIEIAALAVSLEPKGGSPTGAPTEVLFATELAVL